MSDKDRNVKRSHNFCLVTYLTPEEFLPVLNSDNVKSYAYILHDKDTNLDGTIKESHFHICVNLAYAKTVDSVRKMFPDRQNTLADFMHDKEKSYDYLTHEDHPEKYQYKKEDIIKSKNYDIIERANNQAFDICQDIINKVPFCELVSRYGREIVINYHRYKEFALRIMLESDKNFLLDLRAKKMLLESDLRDIEYTLGYLH